MNISHKWIQEEYFDMALPEPEYMLERITKGAFQIEGVEQPGEDFLIDVDVLPNRAHDCLSHRGIAKEIGILLKIPFKDDETKEEEGDSMLDTKLSVAVEDPLLCPRYVGRYVQNIKVGPSPEWLKSRVESIGQRSINNIVDVTNYILFDIGQPLHVFDADKLEGGVIRVRRAKQGETLQTLDGKNVVLDESMLVIADGKDPLAIAGIKGGKKAEVDENTKNIVIEAANFNPVCVRKTSQKVNIKTDASKRYENGFSSEIAGLGMDMATALIKDVAGSDTTIVGPKKDAYAIKEEHTILLISLKKIQDVMGVLISEKEVDEIFTRFGFNYLKKDGEYSVEVPFERLDLRIPEDLVEEVARVYGYDAIPEMLPSDMDFKPQVNKLFYYQNRIRGFLVSKGYSEVETYSFKGKGEVEIVNPFSKDKPFVRANITDGLIDALVFNARNVDLLGDDTINIFEIGSVFTGEKECVVLGLGYLDPKKKKSKAGEKEMLEHILILLSDELGQKVSGEIIDRPEGGAVVQIDLTALVEFLPQPENFGDVLETFPKTSVFKPLSAFPFVVRDVAVFVNSETEQKELEDIIRTHAGTLLAREPRLFDEFIKNQDDGTTRISYAYKLVFQAYDRTLTDVEINTIMDAVYAEIKKNEGWEVR